jgi:hypothetical protein
MVTHLERELPACKLAQSRRYRKFGTPALKESHRTFLGDAYVELSRIIGYERNEPLGDSGLGEEHIERANQGANRNRALLGVLVVFIGYRAEVLPGPKDQRAVVGADSLELHPSDLGTEARQGRYQLMRVHRKVVVVHEEPIARATAQSDRGVVVASVVELKDVHPAGIDSRILEVRGDGLELARVELSGEACSVEKAHEILIALRVGSDRCLRMRSPRRRTDRLF